MVRSSHVIGLSGGGGGGSLETALGSNGLGPRLSLLGVLLGHWGGGCYYYHLGGCYSCCRLGCFRELVTSLLLLPLLHDLLLGSTFTGGQRCLVFISPRRGGGCTEVKIKSSVQSQNYFKWYKIN
jgi:hypothetical protein